MGLGWHSLDMHWIVTLTVALTSLTFGAASTAHEPLIQIHQQTEISRTYGSAISDSEGGEGNSRGRTAIIETMVRSGQDGVELTFDLPSSATEQDRNRQWFYPARILRRSDGVMVLLNRSELEERRDRWLVGGGMTSNDCGRLVFTWTAFRIECDPDQAVQDLAAYDILSFAVREGAMLSDPQARAPAALTEVEGSHGRRFRAVLQLDPAAIMRERAEVDAALAEIASLAGEKRSVERVSGTIEVFFDVDEAGVAYRRIRTLRMETVTAPNFSENETRVEVIERRKLEPA